MNACPALPIGDGASLGAALASIDCRLDGVVGVAYARLFGESGAFPTALTVVLTLYVALVALGLVGGRLRLTLSGAMPRVLAVGLVLTFATAWPAYQVVVTDLLMHGPDQVASALLGGGGSATHGFVRRLDGLFAGYMELAQALQAQGQQASANLQLSAKLAWCGSLLLVLSTAGLLVMARVVLTILLALGPMFIVFALFRGTRGLFEGWLKAVVGFALAPMLVVLGGAGVVALVLPLLDEAMADPVAAGEAVQPLAMLFVAAVVYTLTLCALAWTALAMTRHWRAGASSPAETGHPATISAPTVVAHAPMSAARARATTSRSDGQGGDARLAGLAGALSRAHVGAGATRTTGLPARDASAGGLAPAGNALHRPRATQARWGRHDEGAGLRPHPRGGARP